MSLLEIIAMLIGFSALGGLINHRFLKLPHTIGLVVVALLASGLVLLIEYLVPGTDIQETLSEAIGEIDFQKALMEGMLSALLFAGAAHVDLTELAERKWAIGLMATVGVITSTFIVGGATWALGQALGFDIPFIWALIFGALISPTDPVAVLSILKTVRVPRLLQAKIAGESLLNDGVGVVVFSILVQGLTVERLVRSIIKDATDDPSHPLNSSPEELEAARRAAQAVTPEEGTTPKS